MDETLHLCIDQGNSRTKVALMTADGRLVNDFIYKSFSSSDVERLFELYPIEASVISSVVNIEPSVVNALHRLSKQFVLLDHHTPVPIRNCYDTPQTLGLDRLAAAVGAQALFPAEHLLIIDAGSAVTFDYVSAEGEYRGGNIAPGLKMRFHVLRQMTKKLPLVEVDENELIPLFGRNTHDAIAAGVVRGLSYEVKGYMRSMHDRCDHFCTVLTGGNAPFILNHLHARGGKKWPIHHEKHLVLIGLNAILTYNIQLNHA